MRQEFERVAIVNRGEAAMRFIHAAHEFNQEYGTSLRTIALYTDADRHAMFVREADEAVYLGPAHIVDPTTRQTKCSYVDYGRLEQALATACAEAVWVGWGFVAEHAAFSDLCRDLGIVFIGPDGDTIRRIGDKISSKHLAEQVQVPVVPWSGGPVETPAEARRRAAALGYPLLIKATAGGGGHGIRRVQSADQLIEAFESARSEAFKAFGDSTVFLEHPVEAARHVEVQVIADHYGNTWAVGVRDCTIQRRHQKILEEAPSPVLSPDQDRSLREMAVRLSRAAGYRNAGTVEFLYEPETESFLFMEMNTRLQVEHPVTECTTGLDMVKLQIKVARGARLEGEPPRSTGHAIEVRLNAEDPDHGFAPAPGIVERFRILTGPGVRIDTGLAEGDTVPPEFDSMIAKIIAYGQNRKEALSRLQRALREGSVVIRGGACNKAFLLELLNRVEVQTGRVDTRWLDRLAESGQHVSRAYADVALIQAGIEAYDAELAVEQAQFYASALRGRPLVRREIGRSISLSYRGHSYALTAYRIGPKQYRVDVNGTRVDVRLERLGRYEAWLTVFGRRFNVISVKQEMNYRIEVNGVSHRVDRDEGGVVRAMAPAVVVSVAVRPGDTVAVGDRLAVLEAMKMEMEVVAPFAGRVRQVMTMPNVQVDVGAPLIQIEPTDRNALVAASDCVVIGTSAPSTGEAEDRCSGRREVLEEFRQLMLGFDVDPKHAAVLFDGWSQNRGTCNDDDEIRRLEDEILTIFVDICSLFRREPRLNGPASGEEPCAETYLFSYLRMLDTRGDGLPEPFVNALRCALAHYGVRSLDRSPGLEQSLLWISKSHQRVNEQITPILGVLESRLDGARTLTPAEAESFRTLLDKMISMTRGLFPAVSDLAREVRYRLFDQPLFEQARREVYAQVDDQLAKLAADPDASDRRERMRALVECPQPLLSQFASKFGPASPPLRRLMLEALTSRYYRARSPQNFECHHLDGRCIISAEYMDDGKPARILATHEEYSDLFQAAQALCPLIEATSLDQDVVIDFYLWHMRGLGEADATGFAIASLLNQVNFCRPIRRIVVAVGGPRREEDMGSLQHFTYALTDHGYEEDKFFRGIHPMMAERLHLWRLTNFRIARLPSVEDVYVLHAIAKDNPKDERVFSVAEVRDLTPVRDDTGRIVQLPHLERMFAEALAGIRRFQSRRRSHERLYWNRILLYVWPPLSLRPDEFHHIVQQLAPATEGLGLEQVAVRARIPNPETGELRDMIVRISSPGGTGLLMTFRPATKMQVLKPLTEYDQKVVRMRQRGLIYPYEIIRMLTPAPQDAPAEFPVGDFVEYDLNSDGDLVPVDRPFGKNQANVVVGVIRNFTTKYPEGMTRVLLLGDPSKDLGAIAEPECRRIIAALDLAARMTAPLEWFPISAGAKISMDSGVENMDWIARVLARLVKFTQAGGEVNLVVNGINVGAQPYWNAEATMLMHTRGILVMTPGAAMVLTGKRALDYSGSVSAEDNLGIGGYDRIMGLNGQAQYWAADINEACHILLRHYEHTYVVPGERFPRRSTSTDPIDRDVRLYPHGKNGEDGFAHIGEILSDETNPGRKKSFDIRRVMMSVIDQDQPPLERWAGMQDAETAVVWDTHLGSYPVCLIGIESQPVPRVGFVPADGPDQWTAGTLFPLSSKKVARAINAASNNRPVVLLANLSGFDGSPESMRKLQLEYGAEIGRAVVNFKGPMVFCVISRYHGGAYVVFSRVLNESLEVSALEGTFASVIGGAPAAAVVFASEVEARTRKDPRLEALGKAMAQAEGAEKGRLHSQWNELFKVIHSEKLGEMAAEFDRVHSVHRALDVGALHHIVMPASLRPYLVQAIERGMQNEQRRVDSEKNASSAAQPAFTLRVAS
jgi:acetyl/propionyl-CoA carboxylase alpha subunit/acetyl-CoA carboxylase carboxyltransferase component